MALRWINQRRPFVERSDTPGELGPTLNDRAGGHEAVVAQVVQGSRVLKDRGNVGLHDLEDVAVVFL